MSFVGDQERPHWDNGGRRLLRELTFLYLHRQGSGSKVLSIADLERSLPGRAREDKAKQRARYARLRHFLFNVTDQPHSNELINELFELVVPWFDKARREGELANSGYIAQLESRRWFDYFPKRKRKTASPIADRSLSAARRAAEIADMLSLGFDVTARDYVEAAEHLTGKARCGEHTPTDIDRVGFVTTRYSSTPGNIVRSFTLITPPSGEFPFCWFQNFYRYPARMLSRDCSGVAVKLGNSVVMFGVLPPHEGIKLIILPCAAGDAGLFSGLIATADNTGAPLMGRVVLERTRSKTVDELRRSEKPGVVKYPIPGNLKPSKEVIRRIRNHIAFEVGTEIVFHDNGEDKNITAQRMKSLVGTFCAGKFSFGGVPFNPADHVHYPFNHALLMYDSDESQEHPLDA